MNKRPRKTNIGMFTEENMRAAVNLVLDKEKPISLREAAKITGVKHQTLARYVKKRKQTDPNIEIHMTPKYASRQIFSASEEEMLSEYLLQCSKMCYGKSTRDLRELAYETAHINNIQVPANWHRNKAAGVDWMRSFLKRNNHLSIRQPEGCSIARLTSFNRHNVNMFFDNLNNVLNRSQMFADGARIWNMDETATSTVVNKSKKVIAGKGIKGVNVVAAGEKGSLVTTCCFINAMGNTMPPALIFPRVNFRDHMLNGASPGTLGLASPSGWMIAELFPKVMKHFVTYSNASKENPVLLIFDNHASHFSIKALNMAKESGVIILTLPPHSSNKMQPLDVSCYAPFKAYYAAAVDSWNKQNPGRVFSIYEVAGCVNIAHQKAMTPTTIKNGFQKCGIFPFDRNIFTDDDFLMSAATFIENPNTTENNNAEEPGVSTAHATVVDSPNGVVRTPTREFSIEKNNESPFVSPAEFIGYPKAKPKEKLRRSREKGRSLIATDTPEKRKIEEKAELVARKKSKSQGRLHVKITDEDERNEEELVAIWSDTSSDGGTEFASEDLQDNFGVLDRSPKEGEFILVEFKTKTSVFYVGKVLREVDWVGELEVQFLRRSVKQTNCFYFPQIEDIATVAESDIKAILPNPSNTKGTKRTNSFFKFEIDFFGVKVQ